MNFDGLSLLKPRPLIPRKAERPKRKPAPIEQDPPVSWLSLYPEQDTRTVSPDHETTPDVARAPETAPPPETPAPHVLPTPRWRIANGEFIDVLGPPPPPLAPIQRIKWVPRYLWPPDGKKERPSPLFWNS
jgi:hypothetical protein